MYPATHNFMDDVDGAEPSGWTSSNGANCTTTIIAVLDGHRKVLQLYDNNGGGQCFLKNTFSDQTSGTVELWFRSDDVTDELQIQILPVGEADIGIQIQFESDKIQYYHTAAWNDATGGGILNNTWYHIKIVFDCAADTYDFYLDGVLLDAAIPFRVVQTSLGVLRLLTDDGDSGYYYYVDAIGYSWDANYNIGDNVFWRHYKESEADTLEENDVGTTGTSITWVDQADTAANVVLIAEFNEHKKILHQTNIGGNDHLYHSFATQSTSGFGGVWFKTSDGTKRTNIQWRDDADSICYIVLDTNFYYYVGAVKTDSGVVATNNTWFYIFVKWYADNTWDFWINNVQIASGIATRENQTGGVNRLYLGTYDHDDYIDAPISSLDGDSRGDNRLFDYNDSYTREDCTDNVLNCTYENKLFKWRSAVLYSNTEYTKAEVFFQIHDINSKLAIEGEIKQAIWNGATWTIPLRDKNEDALKNRSSNTFSADDIHDPTDSTSMLKVILPNVSRSDGRLLLVNADTKTDTYSPVTKNYPDGLMLLDISDIGDSVTIIESSGKVHFDDDLASGSVLDFDTAADRDYFTGDPLMSNILEDYNYFEIFGAINPDTGTRFSKVIDNTGSDEKHPFRITNNEFRTQTDVDAYATKIAARTIDVREISLPLQSMGVHDMGTTFDYKYDNTEFTIPQANYYIVSEKMNMDMATSVLVLSEGLMEESKYAAAYERPENYNDSFASEIYETDITTLSLALYPRLGAAWADNGCVQMNAAGELCETTFYVGDKIDNERGIIIKCLFYIIALAGDAAINIVWNIQGRATNCSATVQGVENSSSDLDCTTAARFILLEIPLAVEDVYADTLYLIDIALNDAAPADIKLYNITVEYYKKRSV